MSRWLPAYLAALLAVAAAGCGTSGSNPVLYSEVRFEVAPANGGEFTFAVDSIEAGGVQHTFPEGTIFSGTVPFFFYVEGAAPPYRGTFHGVTGDALTLHVFVTGQTGPTEGFSCGPGDNRVTVGSPEVTTCPTETLPQATDEIRVDVCTPSPGTTSCSVACLPSSGMDSCAVNSGVSGAFSGTIGDPFTTHLVSTLPPSSDVPPGGTPTIYFLDGARENIGVALAGTGQLLQMQLFIQGALKTTVSGTGNIVIREDL